MVRDRRRVGPDRQEQPMATSTSEPRNRRLARRIAPVLAGAALTSTLLVPPGAARAASTVGGPITRAETIARASPWVRDHVMYSQSSATADLKDGYRRDCSGFVSMAWHVSGP